MQSDVPSRNDRPYPDRLDTSRAILTLTDQAAAAHRVDGEPAFDAVVWPETMWHISLDEPWLGWLRRGQFAPESQLRVNRILQRHARLMRLPNELDRPLLIGSVKTNIGHLEAAAGIAGVIKVILSLENEMLPRHLNFEKPSPHIPWDRLAVEVVTDPVPWERNGRPRIAGVSSFGFAGTNAHVILEEAPPTTEPPIVTTAVEPEAAYRLLPLSARTPAALATLAGHYRSWLAEHPEHDPWAPLDLRDPPGWATETKLIALREDAPACRAVLERSAITHDVLEPAGEGACRREDRTRLTDYPLSPNTPPVRP